MESIADAVNGVLPHLHARDVSFVFISQAPLEKLQAYKRRMGWSFPWVSSAHTDFNLTESPGFSTFVNDDDTVYHSYSTTWRGLEFLMSYYPILDHAPKGRDEGEAWQIWIRRHDEYGSK